MFKLLRYFSVTSAIVMVLAIALLITFFHQHERNALIDTAEKQNTALARSFSNSIWPLFSTYLKSVSGLDGDALRERPETREIHDSLQKITAGLPVLKIKIYSLDGKVLFSSEASQIGDDKSNNLGFQSAARQGIPTSKLTFRNTFSAFEGRVMNRNLIASYLPIHNSGGSLEGVFEIYTDVTPLVHKIDQATIRLGIGLPVLFLVLYIILFLIVRRADIILKRQQTELLRVEESKNDRVRSDTLHRFFIDNIDDGAFLIENGKITDVSKVGTEILGYSREELIGQSPYFVVSPSSQDEVRRRVSEGNEEPYESEGQRKDGSTFPIGVRGRQLEYDGRMVRLTTVRDITRQKEVEAELLSARDDAQLANKTKSDFLASMSHELRTPLNAIIGFSDMMQEEVYGPLGNEKYLEYQKDINQSGQHLLELINDILDASAIEAKAMKLYEENASLTDIVTSSIRLMMPRADVGKVKLSSSIDPEFPIIYVDQRRVKQIMLNLLSNAVKFTEEMGEVIIGAQINDDGSASITVKDTGIGMDTEESEKAMVKFGQVDSGINRKYDGTGLGLPLTKGLMVLHGGTLEIESTKGKGTLITVTFPKERVVQNLS